MSKWITPSRALSVISISLHLSLVLRLSYGTFSLNLWNNRTKFLSDLIHSSPTLLVSLWSDLPTWCWWLFPCRFLPLSSHSTLMLFDSHLFIASFVLHLIVWFETFGSHSISAPAQYDASRLMVCALLFITVATREKETYDFQPHVVPWFYSKLYLWYDRSDLSIQKQGSEVPWCHRDWSFSRIAARMNLLFATQEP
jgi:hypothetical protein